MPELRDFLRAVNETKTDLFLENGDPEAVESAYVPFVMNKCMSYFIDTVLIANELNKHPSLGKKPQFHFLLNTVRVRKRFSKWIKPDDLDLIEAVCEYHSCSKRKALEILDVLPQSDIDNIIRKTEKGGKK
ncbi:MAG: hypothetical protein BV459_07620 [Thermoplasmata archaeon M11B2D]|nr:MAG: hypothetical protein BV459_07620 [Thermoplasmata archaeon M11B2D]